MTSQEFSISNPELQKVVKNGLVFLAPLGVLYLGAVTLNIQDGLVLSDFTPSNEVLGAMVLYILNVALDFLRKFVPNTNQS